MKRIKHFLLGLSLIFGSPQSLVGLTMTLINSSGESLEIEVEASNGFLDVMEKIQCCLNSSLSETNEEDLTLKSFYSCDETSACDSFAFMFTNNQVVVRAKKAWREYHMSLSNQEKKDLSYIVKSLARDSLISIASSKSSLKRAGERIDHIHPLRFLECIFTEEELKAGIQAIRDRGGWIWSEFISGVTGSLADEYSRNNLMQFISDFAKRVSIGEDRILPSLQEKKWSDFVNILIHEIPRQVDPHRYDM